MSWLPWLTLLAVLVAVTLLAYRRPPQIELTRELPPNVFEGGEVGLRVSLRVRAPLPVRVYLADPPPRTLVPDKMLDFGGLLWGEGEYELAARLRANRRGVYGWPGARLRWADPFGLRWREVALPLATELEVYPGAHGLALPNLLRPLLSEGELTRTLGLDDPLSLRGARPYLPGDPPARIAWKLSARSGTPMVRELERTASGALHVHLDLQGGETYLDSAARLAASLLLEAQEARLLVAVSTPLGATEPGTSQEALRRALRLLAQARTSDAEPDIPMPRRGSNLIVLTQRAGDALVKAALRARAEAGRVVLVVLPEGFYLEPGELGRPMHGAPPEGVRDLERRANILAESGVLVFVLRGNQSVLRLGG